MKSLAVWISIFISQMAFAGTFSVEARNSNELYLSAPDCESLKAEVEAIQQWARSRSETPNEFEIDCGRTPLLKEANIIAIVPQLVRENYGVFPFCGGPNCWNWSLVESKVSPIFRYMDGQEWKFYLKNYCKIRDVGGGEHVLPGDIGAIRSRKDGSENNESIPTEIEEVHGFININQIASTKNGYSTSSSYTIQSIDELFEYYSVSPFRECKTGLIDPPSYCKTYVNYYQCSKEYGKSMESSSDFQFFVSFLEESHLLEGIASIMKSEGREGRSTLRKSITDLSHLSLLTPEIQELRDAIVVSLRAQLYLLAGLPSNFRSEK